MEGKEEDVSLGANRFPERQPIGTAAQSQDDGKDYKEPPPAPLFEPSELTSWSFYRAGIAEFVATFLFLYITILTVMGVKRSSSMCSTVGIQGIAWAFGGMIFALVYCTAGISGTNIPVLPPSSKTNKLYVESSQNSINLGCASFSLFFKQEVIFN